MPIQQSFQKEIIAFLGEHDIPFSEYTKDTKKLDFVIWNKKRTKQFFFDAKEKIQRINTNNWRLGDIPEKFAFIIDDLAARKVLFYAPNSGSVIRDNVYGGYYFFSVLDLFLMPKRRVNRPIEKNVRSYKGKWIIDLRNGKTADDLAGMLRHINHYYVNRERWMTEEPLQCFGEYQGEVIPLQGQVRRPEHWNTDVEKTR